MKNYFDIKQIVLSLILSILFINITFATENVKVNNDDFIGKKIGVTVGSAQEKWAEEHLTKSEIVYFANFPDGILAAKTGIVDAMFFSDLSF